MITTKNLSYIEDLSYETAEEFLHDISYDGKLYNIFDNNFIFRGHSSDGYKLRSLVQRTIPYLGQRIFIARIWITLARIKMLSHQMNDMKRFFFLNKISNSSLILSLGEFSLFLFLFNKS